MKALFRQFAVGLLILLMGCPDDGMPMPDGAVDDAGDDAGMDSGADTGEEVDSGTDAGIDSGTDAGIDSGTDTGGGTSAIGNCCDAHATSGCDNAEIEACVCMEEDGYCCMNPWDDACVEYVAGCAGFETACEGDPGGEVDPRMTFFVTSESVSDGGDLGGLGGADASCQRLAEAALPDNGRTWRALLCTSTSDARDRIGAGPWRNAAGEVVASDVDALFATPPASSLILDERGREGEEGGPHDVLSGCRTDGRRLANMTEFESKLAFSDCTFTYTATAFDFTCADWTSSDPGGAGNTRSAFAIAGHIDWDTVPEGACAEPPERVSRSWLSSHATACDAATMAKDLGAGRVYCFAEAE